MTCGSVPRCQEIADHHHSLAGELEYANHSAKSGSMIIFLYLGVDDHERVYTTLINSNVCSSTSSKLYPDNDFRNVFSHQQELGSHHRSPSEGQIREAHEHILQSREFKFTK